jgi:hypothetical protein
MSIAVNSRKITHVALVQWLNDPTQSSCTIYLKQGTPFETLTKPLECRFDISILSMLKDIANSSETGAVLFHKQDKLHLLLPPFPIQIDAIYLKWEPNPLLAILAQEPWICVVLLRLGRYAVGIYHGKQLVFSKSGNRYVKGRHHAGGTSQARFARIREGQVNALFSIVCRLLQNSLDTYRGDLEHLFLGGERQTLLAFRRRCPYLASLASLTRRRNLNIRTPGNQALVDLPSQLWTSQMVTIALPG